MQQFYKIGEIPAETYGKPVWKHGFCCLDVIKEKGADGAFSWSGA